MEKWKLFLSVATIGIVIVLGCFGYYAYIQVCVQLCLTKYYCSIPGDFQRMECYRECGASPEYDIYIFMVMVVLAIVTYICLLLAERSSEGVS